jgi:hypothetical protein
MLPGFRFLFVAIVLSMSMLIFGLGAAALLRAAHEEFASIPSRRAQPEVMFTQQSDDRPALAMLRVEPSADEKILNLAATDNVQIAAPTEQSAITSAASEPETRAADPDKIATRTDIASPAENSPPEAAKPQASTAELSVQAETPASADTPSPAGETKVATIAETPMAAPEPASAPLDDSTRIAETRIATLGGPPVTIETQIPAKSAPAVMKKQAKRAVKQRRVTRRAPVTLQASQKPADPFAQPIGR